MRLLFNIGQKITLCHSVVATSHLIMEPRSARYIMTSIEGKNSTTKKKIKKYKSRAKESGLNAF